MTVKTTLPGCPEARSEPANSPAAETEKKESRQVRRAREREARRQAKKAARQLRQQQVKQGLKPPSTTTIANTVSPWKSQEEEQEARQGAVEEQVKVYRQLLPHLLRRLGKIPDPRNPKLIRHKLTVLMLYGILVFVYQMSSRREANRQMTLPQFEENLRLLFPELESLPHQDTLNRLLARIDVNQLEQAHVALLQCCMRQKKFVRYLVNHRYPVAIDGTQKLVRGHLENEEWLEREHKKPQADGSTQSTMEYYVYVLEANLVLAEGLTLPLMSEFLSFSQGDQEKEKQDCERKAFVRLAQRLKGYFPRLPLLLVLDALYATGPILELCRGYPWQFMIVLQEGSLPWVWEEVRGLGQLQRANRLEQQQGIRRQRFSWVNDIEYRYGEKERKRQTVHVVICQESWEEVNPQTVAVEKQTSRHVWLSSEPLNRNNVQARCNLQARRRWGIESGLLVEKQHGYQYEHSFSYNWSALKGYHFLMRLGHLLNILAQRTVALARLVKSRGVRGLIQFLRETCSGPWLNAERIRCLLNRPGQLRLQ
jgi:hypothetical protein